MVPNGRCQDIYVAFDYLSLPVVTFRIQIINTITCFKSLAQTIRCGQVSLGYRFIELACEGRQMDALIHTYDDVADKVL